MIEIIKGDIVYEQTCEHCKSHLRFEEYDAHEGAFGAYYITCPICNNELYVDEITPANLSETNIKFPINFTKYDSKLGAKDISDNEIESEVRRCVKLCRQDKEDSCMHHISYGNVFIMAHKCNDEITIVVAKNYYESVIDINYGYNND